MRLTQEQIDGIVRRHLPKGWTLRIRKFPDGARGMCSFRRRTIFLSRPIKTRADVFVFFHEVGHMRCQHWDTPNHISEYQAERYAILAMRLEGIPVPRDELRIAKQNVFREVFEFERAGGRTDPVIKRWCRP